MDPPATEEASVNWVEAPMETDDALKFTTGKKIYLSCYSGAPMQPEVSVTVTP